ncbi:MAG: peptide deformylase [Melioribacteraceae bacterium]|nr:peptide deformylase [Melioribacteraceae bacterium]
MAILPITVYGDKILREKTKSVKQVDDGIIKNIKDMFETMRNARGIGLAANQVGLDKSIFIIDLSEMEDYRDMKPMVFINPVIESRSDELIIFEEGCLSLPLLRADVVRPESLQIRYIDTEEKEQVMEADDWPARVILHEYDHLIGKLIPDRVDADIKKELKEQLSDIKSRKVQVDYPITTL